MDKQAIKQEFKSNQKKIDNRKTSKQERKSYIKRNNYLLSLLKEIDAQ